MLDKVRKFSGSIFAKIILAIVAVPFIFWGMGSSFNQGGTNTLAKINNERISTDEFINAVNANSIIISEIPSRVNARWQGRNDVYFPYYSKRLM